MKNTPHRSRGSSLIAVLFMFILMTAAITSLSLLFATENRRTLATASHAQLDQLLLAAQTIAANELHQHGPEKRDIPVTTPIPDATLTLSITPAEKNQVQIHVLAKLPHTTASQMLIYSHTDSGAWRLESAILGNEP